MSSKAESKDINGAAAGHQPVAAKERYAFGGHLLEATPRLLSRQGERLAITPKSFDVLLLLVRNPGRVIGKEEFFQTLWPDSVVEEANLTQTIFVLRKILREKESGHSFISTIPGRGYSFVCPVTRIEEPPAHAVDSPPVHGGSRPSRALWVGIGVGTSICLAALFLLWFFRREPSGISRLQSLTAYAGTESWPAFSPDGSQVVFVWDNAGPPESQPLYSANWKRSARSPNPWIERRNHSFLVSRWEDYRFRARGSGVRIDLHRRRCRRTGTISPRDLSDRNRPVRTLPGLVPGWQVARRDTQENHGGGGSADSDPRWRNCGRSTVIDQSALTYPLRQQPGVFPGWPLRCLYADRAVFGCRYLCSASQSRRESARPCAADYV